MMEAFYSWKQVNLGSLEKALSASHDVERVFVDNKLSLLYLEEENLVVDFSNFSAIISKGDIADYEDIERVIANHYPHSVSLPELLTGSFMLGSVVFYSASLLL